jgi:hypothetical protein
MGLIENIDTELDFYLKDTDQFHCLNCTLIECRQDDEGCYYRNTIGAKREKDREYQGRTREKKALMRKKYDGRSRARPKKPKPSRVEYYAEYYRRNRESKLAAANERHRRKNDNTENNSTQNVARDPDRDSRTRDARSDQPAS